MLCCQHNCPYARFSSLHKYSKLKTSNFVTIGVMLLLLSSSSACDSTHICTALHLACWLQMQLPDYFLIRPSGQLSAGSQLKGITVSFLVRLLFFLMFCFPELEHIFKRMARVNGKLPGGQRACLSCPEKREKCFTKISTSVLEKERSLKRSINEVIQCR